jgi:hypothetical protein
MAQTHDSTEVSPQPAELDGVQHELVPVLPLQFKPQSAVPSHHWTVLAVGQQPA